ncbi:glycosyltransferase family 2 protein [Acinetobacter sp. ULE_I001]|uniref:glycosyltransferase family 2 protein n=1 Tax=unclassified Acinetobacter TaxID=196816 RepID=UPI003AF8F4A5
MNKLCSLIVPVYNEEKNIHRCLSVIFNQNYDNLEVIFVNDGSTDKSRNIIENEMKNNKKIILINQENKGAATARKKGICCANGEYIAILDCDDELSNNAISEAMKRFEADIDIVLFDLKYSSMDGNEKIINNFSYYTEQKKIKGIDALNSSLTTNWGVHGLGIYKKKIFLKSYAQYEKYNLENYINNDEVITRLCFLNTQNMFLSNGKYFYNNNIESTTKRINRELYKKIYNSLILYDILEKDNPSFSKPSVIMSYIWEAYVFFKLHHKNLDNAIEWRKGISDGLVKIKEKKLFFSLTFKEKFKYILLKIQGYI